ncbi:MAG TPA: hypothetical protein VKT78_19440 [Fimbriimonadaceae bacterium]|nr:hypothetical protein [Fimbriimonadaceae bacterium]
MLVNTENSRARLNELYSTLPARSNVIEEQARALLRLLTNATIEGIARPAEPVPEDPKCCPNCDAPCSLTRSPYCSTRCREISGFVRQFRAGLADGAILDPERQVAFGQNLWQLLGGGLPLRKHLIPDKVIAQVIAKQGGTCAHCSAPATTVEHIGTACNRPINLRAVCAECDETKAFGDPAVLERPEANALLRDLVTRIRSHAPLRCCDDPAGWDWRSYLAKRHTSNQA